MLRRIPIILIVLVLFSCTKDNKQHQTIVWNDSSKELAEAILNDRTLNVVDSMGHALLTRGFDAGGVYSSEIWIRDFNTFLEVASDVVPLEEIRNVLTHFLELQQENGEIVDSYMLREKYAMHDNHPYYSDLAQDYLGFKNTVETDQETSLIQAVRKYVEKSGDSAFLSQDISGRTVYERLQDAISYLLKEKFDEKYHLLTGALTCDWGDVENDSINWIDIGEGSTITADIYDNAMMIIALKDMERLTSDQAEKTKWRNMAEEFTQAVRQNLWNAENGRFIPHLYPDGKPKEVDFDESLIYYHGGTAVAIEADLLTKEEIKKVNDDMLRNVRESGMPSIGLTVYPTYPPNFFLRAGMERPFIYQNGGDWTWFGGRMIQQLIRNGFVAEAYQEVRPMIDRVIVNGDFYEWYGQGGIPRGSSGYKGSAGVLCKAISMFRAWAEEQQHRP